MNKLISVLLTAALLIASNAYAASTLEDADKAYASKNYAEAIKIYKALALKGDAKGQYYYGHMHDMGQGTIEDYAEAVKWYKLAAEQGNAEAQSSLGQNYHLGKGITKDLIKAHMWVNLSANKAAAATIIRGWIAEEMTQQQIAEAQKLARECLARKYKGC
jgi:TPR repeat protein